MDYQAKLIQSIFKQGDTSVDSTSTLSQHPATQVYHNNYIENGIRALSIGFSSVAGMLDEGDFRRLAHEYLLARPKACFDWADYGAGFAEFMFEVDALAQMPFLPELAELDWRLMHIERASDRHFDAASFALLQSEDANSLRFLTSPGLQLMQAIFPLVELYALVHDKRLNQDSPESQELRAAHLQSINKSISLAINSGESRSIVLWREDYKGLFEYTNGADINAFKSMLADEPIAAVLSAFEDDQGAMTHWLQSHIQTKKIYGIVKNE